MPAYNAATTIGVAIRSVLEQSNPDLELLVIDDGSTDATAAVVTALAVQDGRIRLVRQRNAGPSAARNNGASLAQGAFIAFLDADDRWDAGLLTAHEAAMDADPSAGATFCRVLFFDHLLRVPGRVSAHVARPDVTSALGENPLCTASNLVVRREAFAQVGGFDPALSHAEDQEWLLRLLATTPWQAAGIDIALVHYRMSQHGLSADLDAMLDGWLRMIARVRAYAPQPVQSHGSAAEALFRRYLARRALRTGQGAGPALRHLAAALRCSPRALAVHDGWRTLLTIAGALALAILPAPLVRRWITR